MSKIYVVYTQNEDGTVFLMNKHGYAFFHDKEEALRACKKENWSLLEDNKKFSYKEYKFDMDVLECKEDEEFVDIVSEYNNINDEVYYGYYSVEEFCDE